MEMITVYSFKTKERKVIPMAELAPGLVKVKLTGDGKPDATVWVHAEELVGHQRELRLRQPPFDNAHKAIFRTLKESLDEVHPLTLEQWELGFRCDMKPEFEIAKWRWLAYVYARLTDPSDWKRINRVPSRTLKKDFFRLLLTWMNTKDVAEVLATTLPFEELPEDFVRPMLEGCKVIPAEFFGGKLVRLLGRLGVGAGRQPRELSPTMVGKGRTHELLHLLDGMGNVEAIVFVIDYAALKSLDEFKAKAALETSSWRWIGQRATFRLFTVSKL
jgi:hypothetical protein